MHNLKKISLVLFVFAIVVVVSVGYKGNDILQRGIVLGVGVDAADGGVDVTVEVVSPGNGSEQVGTFSKTVTAFGKTVAEALQSIAEKTGKETSLGQCVLIVYGEEMMRRGFADEADYFIKSDSFKESTVVCCCQGSANELLNKGDALSQSVSLSLADKLKDVAKFVALPSCDLLAFSRSQRELYRTGYLNFVRFQSTPYVNSDNSRQQQGYFVSQEVAVFKDNAFVGILNERETNGLAVLSQKVSGNVFSVEDDQLVTLRVNTKNVSAKLTEKGVDVFVDIYVKTARTDSFGAGGKFTAKTESEISENALKQTKQQAERLARELLQRQIDLDVDLIGLHELFRQKYGATERVKTLSMQEIPVNFVVSVSEK